MKKNKLILLSRVLLMVIDFTKYSFNKLKILSELDYAPVDNQSCRSRSVSVSRKIPLKMGTMDGSNFHRLKHFLRLRTWNLPDQMPNNFEQGGTKLSFPSQRSQFQHQNFIFKPPILTELRKSKGPLPRCFSPGKAIPM